MSTSVDSPLALPVSTDTKFVRDKPVCLHSPSPVHYPAAAAAADTKMQVRHLCPCLECGAGLVSPLLPWTPRPLPRRVPRWGFGLGPACISIMTSRRPADHDQPRPGPVQGPAPGPSCLVRRWVRPRPAAKPAAQRKAAREPAPTTRHAPATELRLVLALRPVRAWVLLFVGRVYKHGASIYEMRTGTCMCRSAHKTRTHMIRCIDEPTSTETVARSVNEWQSKSKGSRDEAPTIG